MRGTDMPLTALCSLDMNVSYYAAGQHSNPKNPGLFFSGWTRWYNEISYVIMRSVWNGSTVTLVLENCPWDCIMWYTNTEDVHYNYSYREIRYERSGSVVSLYEWSSNIGSLKQRFSCIMWTDNKQLLKWYFTAQRYHHVLFFSAWSPIMSCTLWCWWYCVDSAHRLREMKEMSTSMYLYASPLCQIAPMMGWCMVDGCRKRDREREKESITWIFVWKEKYDKIIFVQISKEFIRTDVWSRNMK